jgi:hypothetical protein
VKKQLLAGALAVGIVLSIAPTLASAQVFPFPRNQNGNYHYGGRTSRITGVVSSFGGFNMMLNGDRAVVLHQGTIINPRGTTIQPGMHVVVYGYPTNNGFAANEIDVNGYDSGNGRDHGRHHRWDDRHHDPDHDGD